VALGQTPLGFLALTVGFRTGGNVDHGLFEAVDRLGEIAGPEEVVALFELTQAGDFPGLAEDFLPLSQDLGRFLGILGKPARFAECGRGHRYGDIHLRGGRLVHRIGLRLRIHPAEEIVQAVGPLQGRLVVTEEVVQRDGALVRRGWGGFGGRAAVETLQQIVQRLIVLGKDGPHRGPQGQQDCHESGSDGSHRRFLLVRILQKSSAPESLWGSTEKDGVFRVIVVQGGPFR